MPITSNVNVDSIVNGLETVTGASTITDSVVTERCPVMNTREHTVGAGGYVRLGRTENTIGITIDQPSVCIEANMHDVPL